MRTELDMFDDYKTSSYLYLCSLFVLGMTATAACSNTQIKYTAERSVREAYTNRDKASYDLAEKGFMTALQTSENIDYYEGKAEALLGIAILYFDRGDYKAALLKCDTALATIVRTKSKSLELEEKYFRTRVLFALGYNHKAKIVIDDALDGLKSRDKEHRILKARFLGQLSRFYRISGAPNKSKKNAKEAWAIIEKEETVPLHQKATALNHIGDSCFELGEYGEAIKVYQKALVQQSKSPARI